MNKVYGPDQASVTAYTFKEGVLSAVGHDLKLAFDRFRIEVGPDSVTAEFDPTSIRAVCARKGRSDAPGLLSEADSRQIEENARGPVLEVGRFPTIRFVSGSIDKDDPEEWEIAGQLTLHGASRAVRGVARLEGADRVARFALSQPDFGIRPFSALLGALKVQPRVEVEIRLPAG